MISSENYEVPIYATKRESARTSLKNKICGWYGVPSCELFLSGTHAIYMILDSLASYFKSGIFLVKDDVYIETRTNIIPALQLRYPMIEFKFISSLNDNLEGQVLLVDSCSNPHGYISNCKVKIPYLVVDNTWLSPYVFNPFLSMTPASIVIDSCTKYISGSHCMLGSACFSSSEDPILSIVQSQMEIQGLQIPPLSCQIIAEQIDFLSLRIQHSYARTQNAIKALQSSSKVDIINHPLIHSPEQMYLLKDGPSVVCIHLLTDHIYNKMDRNKIITTAGFAFMTSFAHPRDSIEPYVQYDETGVWIRISFGYAENSEIESKINNLLSRW